MQASHQAFETYRPLLLPVLWSRLRGALPVRVYVSRTKDSPGAYGQITPSVDPWTGPPRSAFSLLSRAFTLEARDSATGKGTGSGAPRSGLRFCGRWTLFVAGHICSWWRSSSLQSTTRSAGKGRTDRTNNVRTGCLNALHIGDTYDCTEGRWTCAKKWCVVAAVPGSLDLGQYGWPDCRSPGSLSVPAASRFPIA